MNLDDLTIKQVREIKSMGVCKDEECFWIKGEKYLIRTVTMIVTGELVGVSEKELLLKDAAWVADTGRFSDALLDIEKFKEVEPYHNNVLVGRGSIIDATTIDSLPRIQK